MENNFFQYTQVDNELTKLINIASTDLLHQTCKNEDTSKETLQQLAETLTDIKALEYIAANYTTLPQTLTYLAETKTDFLIIHALTGNKHTPTAALDSLFTGIEIMNSANVRICELIAKNPNTSTALLTQLSKIANEEVQMAVANNTKTTAETLHYLALGGMEDILWYVVNNANIANDTLKKLYRYSEDLEIKEIVEEIRIFRLKEYIETLPADLKLQAQLVSPSFTGWPDDLTDLLTNLNKP